MARPKKDNRRTSRHHGLCRFPKVLNVPQSLRKKDYSLILLVRNDDIPSVPEEAYDDIWPIEYAELLVKKLRADLNAA
jgi:hypothetical protein